MSIYATLWHLKFPRHGDNSTSCDWIGVIAQGVPAHIGTPTPGFGYEDGDPYAAFLPPPVVIFSEEDEEKLRAVVFVAEGAPKGTERSHQEYIAPLLVLTGEEYATMPFGVLYEGICDALRGTSRRPERASLQLGAGPGGGVNASGFPLWNQDAKDLKDE